jgi:hypothetical protein
MSKERLSDLHSGVEAQLRWALAYEGDGELLELLRSESRRLSAQLALGCDRLQPRNGAVADVK